MKRFVKIALCGIILLALILLFSSIVQAFQNNTFAEYLTAPLYTILNIFVAVIFAFFLTQYKSDLRKRKEIVEKLSEKIINDFSNDKMFTITSEETIKHIRIAQRSVDNRINLLKEYEKEMGIKDDISYVSENFQTYWQTISNHIDDIEHLTKAKDELFHCTTNIINRLERMTVCLHK